MQYNKYFCSRKWIHSQKFLIFSYFVSLFSFFYSFYTIEFFSSSYRRSSIIYKVHLYFYDRTINYTNKINNFHAFFSSHCSFNKGIEVLYTHTHSHTQNFSFIYISSLVRLRENGAEGKWKLWLFSRCNKKEWIMSKVVWKWMRLNWGQNHYLIII